MVRASHASRRRSGFEAFLANAYWDRADCAARSRIFWILGVQIRLDGRWYHVGQIHQERQ